MNNMRYIFLLLLATNLLALDNQLTLEECISYAKRNAPDSEIARARYTSRLENYRAFKAGFLPQLSLNGSVPGLVRDINQIVLDDGSLQFIEQSQLVSSSNLTLSQSIATTGTGIFLSSGLNRLDVFGNNEYTSWRAAPLNVSISQPIFGFISTRWDSKIEDLNYEKAREEYSVDMEAVARNIANLYFNCYIAEMELNNSKLNLAINDTLYMVSQGRFKVGKIAENDLLQSELALLNAQNTLENAEINFQESMEQLFIEIGFRGDYEDFELTPELSVESIEIDEDLAINQALENRPDLVDFEIRKLQAERTINRIERDNSFNATLSASYGLNQASPELENAYDNLLEQERLNLNFEIPLFQWGRADARLESALAEKDIVTQDIDRSKRVFAMNIKYQTLRFRQLQKQVDLSRKARDIAEKRFEVSKNRFNNNMIDMNSFFIAQNEKDNAVRSYVRTIRDYWVAYYNLRMMTLYDFKENKKINYRIN